LPPERGKSFLGLIALAEIGRPAATVPDGLPLVLNIGFTGGICWASGATFFALPAVFEGGGSGGVHCGGASFFG